MPPPGPVQAERRHPAAGLSSMQVPRSAPLMTLRAPAAISPLPSRIRPSDAMVVVPRPKSRGERLANALRRGFVSSRVLNIRAGPAALSELIGPLAPERYVSLPSRSIVSARAMVCVTLAKGNRDIKRLETFRLKGSLRITGDGRRSTGDDGSTPRKWFDDVADALLGNPVGNALGDALDTLKALEIGPNKSHSTMRRAQMPAEAFRLDATGGVDFSEVTAPARDADLPDMRIASPISKPALNGTNIEALQSADSFQRSPPQDVIFADLDAEDRAPLLGAGVAEAPEKMVQDITDMEVDRVVKDMEETQTQPLDEIDIVEVASPQKPVVDSVVLSLSSDPSPAKSDTQPLTSDSAMEGTWYTHSLTGRKGSRSKLSLVGRVDQGKLVVGVVFDCQEPQLAEVGDRKEAKSVMEVVKTQDLPTLDLRMEATDPEAGYSVRNDGPTGMLTELLQEMHTSELSPTRRQSRKSLTEIVVVDGDEGKDREIQEIPSSTKRPRKKKGVSFTRSDRKQMEERKAKFMSTVVQTMQEEPAIVKKRQNRASAPISLNGHRTITRKNEDREGRRSGRRKKNVSLVESSDDNSSPSGKAEDTAFEIDDVDDGAIEVTMDSSGPSPRSPMQVGTGASSRRNGKKSRSVQAKEVGQQLNRSGTQRPRAPDSVNAEPVCKKPRAGTKDSLNAWSKRIERIEKAIAAHETGSPPLSDVEEDIESMMLFETISTLGKIMGAIRDGEHGLLECDQYSQQNAVIQAYKDTKNDPEYAAGAKSPGTRFYLDTWKDRRARKNKQFDVSKVDDRSGESSSALGLNGTTCANSGSTGKLRSAELSEHTGTSSTGSDSTGRDGDKGDGEETAQREREEASERARELQSRVCGNLLETMPAEAKRRVLRWAEADCSWFDEGMDMMEIVASRVVKSCPQCDARDGNYDEKCEESILLKLWSNMTWRKIRRMRHRDRGTIN